MLNRFPFIDRDIHIKILALLSFEDLLNVLMVSTHFPPLMENIFKLKLRNEYPAQFFIVEQQSKPPKFSWKKKFYKIAWKYNNTQFKCNADLFESVKVHDFERFKMYIEGSVRDVSKKTYACQIIEDIFSRDFDHIPLMAWAGNDKQFHDYFFSWLEKDCTSEEEKGRYLIGLIVSNKPHEEIEAFINTGVDINYRVPPAYQVPLAYAVAAGNFPMVQFLWEKGANIQEQAVYLAMVGLNGNNSAMLDFLLHKAIEFNFPVEQVFLTVIHTNNIKLLRQLLVHPRFIPTQAKLCEYLHAAIACRDGKIDAVKLLLEKGADINYRMPSREDKSRDLSVLEIAVCFSKFRIANYLLPLMNLEITQTNLNRFLLDIAELAIFDHILRRKEFNSRHMFIFLENLLNHGLMFDKKILHKFANTHFAKTIEFLLDKAIDKYTVVELSQVLPHFVRNDTQRNHENIVEILLKRGANIDLIEKKWEQSLNLLSFALRNEKTLLLLLRYSKNINLNATFDTSWHRAPLMPAAVEHYTAGAVEILLRFGAKLEIVDVQGRTPLQIAITRGDVEIIRVIAIQMLKNYCEKSKPSCFASMWCGSSQRRKNQAARTLLTVMTDDAFSRSLLIPYEAELFEGELGEIARLLGLKKEDLELVSIIQNTK